MNRRDFLLNATASGFSLAMAMGATELRADPLEAAKKKPSGPPVNCAVIGLGTQGQAILASLARLGPDFANISTICDTYDSPGFLKRSTAIVPAAKFVKDYHQVLDDKAVKAIFIATPSHKHTQIALDAISAGKHVYCEAPLANDLDQAKSIAKAAIAAPTMFMPGLQVRSNAQAEHVLKFIRSSYLGTMTSGRAQYHNRTSWKLGWPDEARASDLNWRLSKVTSMGLVGEVGIHQIDTATWYFKALPISVTGASALIERKDGRDVADNVQCIIQYPNDINFLYDASLTTSYDSIKPTNAYEVFCGTKGTIQLRDQKAWCFKESDANDVGWETFARKDDYTIGVPKNNTGIKLGTGIALVADASKQLALGATSVKDTTDVTKTSLYQAIEALLTAIQTNKKPEVTALEGYQATVVANKCNEAAITGTKINFQPEWFTL